MRHAAPMIPTSIGSTTVSVNSVAIAGGKHLGARGRGQRMIADHHPTTAAGRLLLTFEKSCPLDRASEQP
jgi:hypothetical protein